MKAANPILRPSQLIGFVLWRAGLLLIASYSFFRGARLLLSVVDLPLQLEIGIGLVLTGAALVILSLFLERMQDRRQEGELQG